VIGVEVEEVRKVSERSDTSAPDVVSRIADGGVDMVFNTPFGARARSDGYLIRTAAVQAGVPCCTTMAGMAAAVHAIEAAALGGDGGVRPLQAWLGGDRCR
jgi:carbamoyl-phosphate synthase large subunit